MYDFYLYDLHLYLDTHPDCQKALAEFDKYSKLSEVATKAYNKKYGPINPSQIDTSDGFSWVNGPWPWERSEN